MRIYPPLEQRPLLLQKPPQRQPPAPYPGRYSTPTIMSSYFRDTTLEDTGVVTIEGEQVLSASACARHLDALGLIAI